VPGIQPSRQQLDKIHSCSFVLLCLLHHHHQITSLPPPSPPLPRVACGTCNKQTRSA
jgi:hypothetical protein